MGTTIRAASQDSETFALNLPFVAPNNKPQQPKSRCKLPSGPPLSNDLERLVNVYSAVTHPLELLGANGCMFATSGVLAAGTASAAVVGCLGPTPFEPATCIAGVAARGVTAGAGTITAHVGVHFFNQYTLPAIKNWDVPTRGL